MRVMRMVVFWNALKKKNGNLFESAIIHTFAI